MHFTITGRRRTAGLTIALAAILTVGEIVAPVVATATATTTLFVSPATTTINPAGSTGSSFDVTVSFNAAVDTSGAGAALSFDKTKLQLTGIAKDATEAANITNSGNGGWGGFPSLANTATFLANANAAGEIPSISWFYISTDSEPAGVDHGIFRATFKVTATGDSTLTPVIDTYGGIIDGTVANYGSPVTVDSTITGSVVNPAPPTPPTGSITALAAWLATNTVAVKWGGTPGANPIATYDVRYRKAAYNATMPATYTLWQNATALTTANFTTAPGTTYCFSELARDNASHVSAWTAETCTAAPLDDRSLTKSGTWSAKSSSAFYRSTYLLSTKSGAKLTRTGVKVKRLALVATTCPTCGSVKVYLGSKLLKTVSLKSTATVNKKLITVYTFSAVTSGTLSITVSTSGKKVLIDGVVISAR